MSRLVLLLPPDADTPVHWLVVDADADGGAIVGRGRGDDWPRPQAPIEGAALPAMLLAPAAAVTLHRALLPDLAPRQAQAAARLMAVENALGDPAELHVASGPREPDGALDVAVVANADMVAWLGWAAAHGIDAAPVVPAGLLLPRPEEGFARAAIGAETIARDKSSAFALEEPLATLVVADAAVADVPVADVEAAIIAALDAPPLDLRQGIFARRRRRAIDWRLVRRCAVLLGLILLVALVISLVRIAKLDADTDRLDARALADARTVIPGIADVAQAETALDARAAAAGVGGRGFASGTARLFAALDQSQTVTLTAFDSLADGTIRATLSAPTANALDGVVAALRSTGTGAVTTPVAVPNGGASVQVTLAPR